MIFVPFFPVTDSTMSGGVNVKSLPQAQPGSAIPLHRTRIPSPKPEPKMTSTALPRPSTHIPASNRTSFSSSYAATSSRDMLRDTTLRNQHKLLRGSPPAKRSSTNPPIEFQDSRSAQSSPQVRRKESLLLKSSLDGSRSESLLDLRSNVNKNIQSGCFRFQMGRIDNGNGMISERTKNQEESPVSLSKTGIPSCRFGNKNLRPGAVNTDTSLLRVRRERMSLQNSASSSFSDEEMCTPDDLSPEVPQRPHPEATAAHVHQDTFSINLLKGKQTPKVNMAAVAPFRYRYLQIMHSSYSWCSCFGFQETMPENTI